MSFNYEYFIAGILTTLIVLLMITKKEKILQKRKTNWSKLSKVEYKIDFDYKFEHEICAHDVLLVINEALGKKIQEGCENFKNTNIDAGEYSVDAITTVRFVHRS